MQLVHEDLFSPKYLVATNASLKALGRRELKTMDDWAYTHYADVLKAAKAAG